jgi:hypothetical protein
LKFTSQLNESKKYCGLTALQRRQIGSLFFCSKDPFSLSISGEVTKICLSKTIIHFSLLCKQKQDELLLEDIWTLLRAGRLEEACELCRSAGQVGQLV